MKNRLQRPLRPAHEQVDELCRVFPQLNPRYAYQYIKDVVEADTLPRGAAGWVAFPRPMAIGTTHQMVMGRVLNALKDQYSLHNLIHDTAHHWQSPKTAAAMRSLCLTQNGDILIVAAQLAEGPWTGTHTTKNGGFHLPAFVVGCALLTHPDHIRTLTARWVATEGDDVRIRGREEDRMVPYFLKIGDKFLADLKPADSSLGGCGTSTGFLHIPLMSAT